MTATVLIVDVDGALLVSVAVPAVLCVYGRPQVDVEGEDVKREDEGDDPLEHGARVVVLGEGAGDEADGEEDLDDDEEELDPEGDAEDAVLAVPCSEALVLPADKDCGKDVADDEEEEEDVVQLGVAEGVEDGQQDQAGGADEGEEDGEPAEDLLGGGGVGDEAAAVPQPAVGGEGRVEQDGGNDAAGDEEGLEAGGADVADVGNVLRLAHGGIVSPLLIHDPEDEQAEQGGEPHDPGYDGKDLGRGLLARPRGVGGLRLGKRR